ncbi:hypothetical protein ACFC8N_42900 [Streptomyces sp. NPDC055966]|uniref:hypothetical protein n=1 Tax=Streptomyces sp. NPDC055966 TaxID=3345669 RepID=UPI0035D5D608
MRLYSRTGATALDDPTYGHIEANADGGFDFPNELSDQLHGFCVNGQPLWETDVERQHRLINEELERRKDPATLLGAVEQLVKAAQATKALADPAESKPAPAKRASKRTAPPPKTAE